MKKFSFTFICLFYVLVIVPTHVVAQDFVFGSFPIPLMVIDDNSGVFVELTKEIAKRAGLSASISVTPPMRTVENFQTGKLHAIFPALDVSFPPGAKFERSDSIYLKQDFIFVKKGSKAMKTLADLKGKKVGITKGYPYVRELTENKDLTIEMADSDELNAKKLTAGRIDAFVVEEKTGLQAFKNVGMIDQIEYDPKTPLSKQDVYYAFPADETGKMLSKKVSEAMNAMKADGSFGKIMSKASQ